MLGSHSNPPSERLIAVGRPSIFRVYDYLVGGTASWAIDQYFGDEVLRKSPLMGDVARASQMFVRRVVHYLLATGIRQFIDVGSGVLTSGSTHRVADELAVSSGLDATARVVYVTSDPIVEALAEVQLDRHGDLRRHAVVGATLQNVEDLWRQVLDTDVINEDQPVALLLIGSLDLHEAGVDSDGAINAVAELRKLLPSDSYIALSHLTDEDMSGTLRESLAEADRLYSTWTHNSLVCRSRAEIANMLTGLQLVEPGWTSPSRWHAEVDPVEVDPLPAISQVAVWAGLGHKP